MQLSVRDTAALLKVSTKTIYRWVGEGRIPGYRVSRSFRFDQAELLEWATAHRMDVANALLHDPEELEPIPAFDQALAAGGIHYRVEGGDRDAVLAEVARVVRVPDGDRELVYEALRARENLASTGIGRGLALPHLRNPLRLRRSRPTLSLCLLERPVEWQALDGQPVAALLVILAPTVRGVLQMHMRSLFACRDEGFVHALLGQRTREAVLAEARRVAASFGAR